MGFLGWLTARLSPRRQATWRYHRGMLKAKLHDHEAAIAEYTAVIDMADIPPDLQAMALYNRSLVYSAIAKESQASDDLARLLEMPAAPPRVKTEARRKLLRMDRTSERLDEGPRGSTS